jgi:RNA polymerase sigma-70 factor (ECF subfamily)
MKSVQMIDEPPVRLGPSDAALVLSARADEEWAQEALFRRHVAWVHSLAFRLAANRADAEDLMQEAFGTAFASLADLSEPAAFAGWLRAILVQTAARKLRRHRLHRRHEAEEREPFDPDAFISPAAPPEAVLLLRTIYGRIEQLDGTERVAFLLRRVEGYSLDEVALRMKLSRATVKRRIIAAHRALGLDLDDDLDGAP